VESRIGPFGDGVSVSVSCTVAPILPSPQNLFWTHPMVLLGDDAQLEAHIGLFGDNANL
jgi:hypothetical protein